MKINRIITEERKVEMELSTPYFCKYGSQLLKVIDEKNCIEVQPASGYVSIILCETWLKTTALEKGTEITEQEFNQGFEQAVALICKQMEGTSKQLTEIHNF